MPIDPNFIGFKGQSVREIISARLREIDQQLLDPVYVAYNNKATAEEQKEGVFKFEFKTSGQINEVEASTTTDGWTSSGWTVVTCKNLKRSPNDGPDSLFWILYLEYKPS